MNRPVTARRWLSDVGRAVSWHRRKLAVVAVIAAVLSGLGALAPPVPETVAVLRASRTLPAGEVLTADDVRLDQVPPEVLPDGALVEESAVLGQVLGRGTAAGQLLSRGDLAGQGPAPPGGRVLAPLRLDDDQVAGLLREGMSVDVLAADERSPAARVVASAVRVAAVPPPADDAVANSDGRLVLLEVTPAVAAALARSAVVSHLSVVWR